MENSNKKVQSDTSPKILKWYKEVYSGKDGLSLYFDLNKLDDLENLGETDDKKRPFATIKENTSLSENAKLMKISGDVIFNFSTRGYKGQSRYDILKKYIEEISDKDLKMIYLKKLDYCANHNFEPENCALMPQTGNLQIVKQGIGNDRGDTYIWVLNEYFENGLEIIFNHSSYENKPVLVEYLESLRKSGKKQSIYNYCKLFYNISDTRLIDELIELGSKTIDSELRARKYIDLALSFWNKRKEYYDSLNF